MDPGFERKGPYETFVSSLIDEDTYNGRPRYEYSPHTIMMRYDRKQASIASNGVGSTPFSRIISSVEQNSPATYRRGDGSERVTTYLSSRVGGADAWSNTPSGFMTDLDNAEARSVTTARERLRSKDSFNIGVAVAEALSTAEMLAGTGAYMAKGIIALRQHAASLLTGREKLLALGGAWLQGYYGWGSLASDAFSLDAALRSKVQEPQYITSSSTTRVSRRLGPSQTTGEVQTAYDVSGLVKVGYKATIESEFARNAERWGLINPFTIAWELVPFSFCVDWVIPIGNTLSSLSADAGLKFVDGYVSRVADTRVTHTRRNANIYATEYDPQPGSYQIQNKRFTRRLATSFEPPRLYANENPFNTTRIVNAVALINQAVLGGHSGLPYTYASPPKRIRRL